MPSEDVNGRANIEDPDQTAVRSGSALFSKTCLSEKDINFWTPDNFDVNILKFELRGFFSGVLF